MILTGSLNVMAQYLYNSRSTRNSKSDVAAPRDQDDVNKIEEVPMRASVPVVPVEEVQVKDPVLPTMHHQIQQHLAPEHCGTILDNGFTGIKLLVLLDENITILA